MICDMQSISSETQSDAVIDLTPKETAALLNVNITTLWRWRKRGIGPKARRIGNQLRYRKAEVIDYRDNGESEQAAS
jgi:predicted site-specific integrase-resolvase